MNISDTNALCCARDAKQIARDVQDGHIPECVLLKCAKKNPPKNSNHFGPFAGPQFHLAYSSVLPLPSHEEVRSRRLS